MASSHLKAFALIVAGLLGTADAYAADDWQVGAGPEWQKSLRLAARRAGSWLAVAPSLASP
jgi:hypothetical protein